MIKVWTDAAEAGLLDRFGARGSTFVYLPGAPPVQASALLEHPVWPSPDLRDELARGSVA